MLKQKKTRQIATLGAALCVGAATLTLGPALTAQQAGTERTEQRAEKKSQDPNEKLSAEQTETLMAEMRDLKQSLSNDAQREELQEELASLVCQMQMAEALMKDPQFKKAMKEAMASPEGQKMEQEMKQMMQGSHEQMHDNLLDDPDVVRGTVIMAKAMTITKDMDKQARNMQDGKVKVEEEREELSDTME